MAKKQQSNYLDLKKQIAELEERAKEVRGTEKREVIARIQEAIDVYDIRPSEIRFAGQPRMAKSKVGAGVKSAKAPLQAKYRDAAGNEWIGRGPRPAWLKAALGAGKTLEDFAV